LPSASSAVLKMDDSLSFLELLLKSSSSKPVTVYSGSSLVWL
jgi:hypothetical protein